MTLGMEARGSEAIASTTASTIDVAEFYYSSLLIFCLNCFYRATDLMQSKNQDPVAHSLSHGDDKVFYFQYILCFYCRNRRLIIKHSTFCSAKISILRPQASQLAIVTVVLPIFEILCEKILNCLLIILK